MTVLITLTQAGTDAGPFDLYSNIDGFNIPFAIDIPRSSLIAGYTTSAVPDYAAIIRIKCKGTCSNYVDISCVTAPNSFALFNDSNCDRACIGAGSTTFKL